MHLKDTVNQIRTNRRTCTENCSITELATELFERTTTVMTGTCLRFRLSYRCGLLIILLLWILLVLLWWRLLIVTNRWGWERWLRST